MRANPCSITSSQLLTVLKQAAVSLKGAGIRFALVGGFAVYARGGPQSQHDVDFVLRKSDLLQAVETLSRNGFTPEQPAEDWLVKVHKDEVLVDLIHHISREPVSDELLDRAEELEVESVRMLVVSATDLLMARVSAFSEHNCDFGQVLPMVRALREQIVWDRVIDFANTSPFAYAFLVLVERLGLKCP